MERTLAFTPLYQDANIYIQQLISHYDMHLWSESLSIVLVCEILATDYANVRAFYRLVALLQCFVSNF